MLRLLIEAREQAGMTQVELGKKLKRPQSFVSKIEAGSRGIGIIEFLEIANALGIDVAKFLKDV
jgi:transcriptional regulator with XRE-family HTH domain